MADYLDRQKSASIGSIVSGGIAGNTYSDNTTPTWTTTCYSATSLGLT